jgi:hypothetical protein
MGVVRDGKFEFDAARGAAIEYLLIAALCAFYVCQAKAAASRQA